MSRFNKKGKSLPLVKARGMPNAPSPLLILRYASFDKLRTGRTGKGGEQSPQ